MRLPALMMIAALASGLQTASGEDSNDRRREERKWKALEQRVQQMQTGPDEDAAAQFLGKQANLLLTRAREASESYVRERLVEALDDLVEAREHLAKGRGVRENRRENTSEAEQKNRTARRLERVYFRVRQAGYFADRSGWQDAAGFVTRSREFYQAARAAYDQGRFSHAQHLAEASGEIVSVLENLAQAAVRNPEPPRLQ